MTVVNAIPISWFDFAQNETIVLTNDKGKV